MTFFRTSRGPLRLCSHVRALFPSSSSLSLPLQLLFHLKQEVRAKGNDGRVGGEAEENGYGTKTRISVEDEHKWEGK